MAITLCCSVIVASGQPVVVRFRDVHLFTCLSAVFALLRAYFFTTQKFFEIRKDHGTIPK